MTPGTPPPSPGYPQKLEYRGYPTRGRVTPRPGAGSTRNDRRHLYGS
ncbi:hypothetical protein COLO4_15165 [Corchorus olitorius]|uniref:Uncharacterized protein n=1 Tax=Corchorus olitorius TaxID=93759 RepID=A0A1R3JP43_9ROSI|nr:hypothetical protein COLO4_15165 [Corchorus olitorius]